MNCGKIIIRHKGKNLFAFFSPACCFDEEKRKQKKLTYYPITKGVNHVTCSCGRKYQITVLGNLDDFSNIKKEFLGETKMGENLLKVEFRNIKWDAGPEEILTLPVGIVTYLPAPDDEDLNEYLSDWLSDTYGFCHKGFEYSISKEVED